MATTLVRMPKSYVALLFSIAFLCATIVASPVDLHTFAWSNGGYTGDISHPAYGTHDWISEHALDWLPTEEKQLLTDNLVWYFYGTELPDNKNTPSGVGDTTKHHVYFAIDGTLIDDAAAVRASEEYATAQRAFNEGNLSAAAMHLGMMAHYVADVAVFGHVMDSTTPWGEEVHHQDYENYVLGRTERYGDDFDSFLVYDGALTVTSAYEATVKLARDTTFDLNQRGLNCTWMNQHYNWDDAVFRRRVGESLNLAVNTVSDVLHTFYSETVIPEFPAFHINAILFTVVLVSVILFRIKQRR